MRERSAENSTNVRFTQVGVGPILAVALWWGFVACLQETHALRTLAGDIPLLAAFACAIALLAYAVDAELRAVLARLPAWACATAGVAGIALCAVHAALLLAALPVAAVCLVALGLRPRASRIRPASAASPDARRAAP